MDESEIKEVDYFKCGTLKARAVTEYEGKKIYREVLNADDNEK